MEVALYIISTPIGNRDDITYRALKLLEEVDYLFCEDTRVTNLLLKSYKLQRSLYLYNDFSSDVERKKIIQLLKNDKSVGLVSDAGTPLISDPGYKLVKECRQNDIKIVPICGASALLAALVASGMPTDKFLFWGFIDGKKDLEKIKFRNETIIIYEAPKRILYTLHDILEIVGNIEICIAREITKLYEEIKDGNVGEIINYYENNPDKIKGEFVILLKNKRDEKNFDIEKIKILSNSLSQQLKPKEISTLAVNLGFATDKKEVYDFLLKN